jgi:dihydroxyacetone kinase-like predicted kinase
VRINGYHLKGAIRETLGLLEKEKDILNDINVYPVADGDTGTNLYITLKGTWDGVKELEDRRASIVAQRIAEASLYSAKGNSGVIMSQFFLGFQGGCGWKGIPRNKGFGHCILFWC